MRWGNLLLSLLPAGLCLAGLGRSYMVPLDHDAIRYSKGPLDNAIARLQARLDSGAAKLTHEAEFGYLRGVLKELNIDERSQVLVFSKTSFQAPRIGPRTPRALYFNDNVSVGFVRTGDVLEFATVDAKQGTIFYTLDQEQSGRPRFTRQDMCLQCHQAGATMGIPGLMVRSVTPDRTGMPIMSAGGSITDHRSALNERWGGWYVSGTSGGQGHMGNAVAKNVPEDQRQTPQFQGAGNVTDLSPFFDTGAYPTPHSDIVALMTLEHQTQMADLLIRAGWEARMAMAENFALNKAFGEPEAQIRPSIQHRIDSAVDEVLEYLLFGEEAKLDGPVKGTSGFAEAFSRQGPRDSKGRSLRDFDLQTRLMRYPCSFLIYSDAFDGLPPTVKEQLYRRLYAVVSGQDQSKPFAHLSRDDRQAIYEIVRDTKKGLPAYWQQPSSVVSNR